LPNPNGEVSSPPRESSDEEEQLGQLDKAVEPLICPLLLFIGLTPGQNLLDLSMERGKNRQESSLVSRR
jgi:hypothetical protein